MSVIPATADQLLIRFPWPVLDRVQHAARDFGISPSFYRALEGDQGYAYLPAPAEHEREVVDAWRAALTPVAREATVVRLQRLLDVPGAWAGRPAPFRYAVETDVVAQAETAFNRWYDEEHLPGLAAVPGTVRAMRLRDADGTPRYHAVYDLASPETLGSPSWLAVRGTSWSSQVRPTFRNTRRTMFRRVDG